MMRAYFLFRHLLRKCFPGASADAFFFFSVFLEVLKQLFKSSLGTHYGLTPGVFSDANEAMAVWFSEVVSKHSTSTEWVK